MSAWKDIPTLKGELATLRPLEPEDRDAVLAAASDGRLWEAFYTAVPGPDSIDSWMKKAALDRENRRAMPFAVLDKTGKVIGSTRFMRMNEANRRLEIGTTFYAASAQRSGINTEAKKLLLAHAFEKMDCVCVELRTDWFNRASQRAIERLGAKRNGILRNHSRMADGRVRDIVSYSIIDSEWAGVRQNLDFLLTATKSRPEPGGEGPRKQ